MLLLKWFKETPQAELVMKMVKEVTACFCGFADELLGPLFCLSLRVSRNTGVGQGSGLKRLSPCELPPQTSLVLHMLLPSRAWRRSSSGGNETLD